LTCIPGLIKELNALISECEDQEKRLGKEYDQPVRELIIIINSFVQSYKGRTYYGKGFNGDDPFLTMSPSYEISCIFHKDYMSELKQIKPLASFSREEIKHRLMVRQVSIKAIF
jgi:hypothetical protein